MRSNEWISASSSKAIRLHNVNCVYCGKNFDELLLPTKEHVIGTNFVPRGTLNGQWNLIANACSVCNNTKSQLEDDISLITMLPDLTGKYVNDDELLRSEVDRKSAKSFSRHTKKLVKDSVTPSEIKTSLGNAEISFGFLSPPQVSQERTYKLAHMHVTGFFFHQTYNSETRRGGFYLGDFCPVMSVKKSDWGNEIMLWFMKKVKSWTPTLNAGTAQGYFKIAFWRFADGGPWAWATEWNQNMRTIGFFGPPDALKEQCQDIPAFKKFGYTDASGCQHRFRREKELPPDLDSLFSLDE